MLSKKTQYAIYALVNLARKYNQGPVLIKTIAIEEKIPQKFLESILVDLKILGLVNSKKGKGGGYYLISKPDEINLAFITRNFNGALGLIPCACIISYESCKQCRNESTCGIKKVFRDLRDATANYLEQTTLSDILGKEEALKQLYGKDDSKLKLL
ncbi:MAG: Rrf2 family transcriptional regulator [Bacteroidetes bacterium]|nr:MAG: Rrf2 family transcriptional regulator [Bacteroidota bacterium]